MGVTLERVQFKFASIIGELCSEPDVLSQFAVWVDLRLAEYKLKGSISLDCSGDTPDPVWLKGILSALLAKRLAKQKLKAVAQIQRIPTPPRTNVRKSSAVSNYPRQIEEHQIVTLSPEPVVKQEPSEDLFPVSLHFNETDNLGNGSKSEARKRSATDFLSSISPKERKLDTELDVEPSNESLISIIGNEDDDSTADPSNLSSYANNSGTDYNNMAEEIAENAQKQIDAAMNLEDSYMGSGEVIPTAGTSDSTHPGQGYGASLTTHDFNKPKAVYMGSSFDSPDGAMARVSGTATKTRSHLKIFHNWLQETNQDSRQIEEIPPIELDALLADFFLAVKSKTGADYGPNSFRSIRDSLERHLKAELYPESIIASSLFSGSHIAYKKRLSQIRQRKEVCQKVMSISS